MKKILFMRHGKTNWISESELPYVNLDDLPLSQEGEKEAIKIGKYILDNGMQISKIFYSPIRRAEDTAKIVSSIIGADIQVEERLKKQNFGKWDYEVPRNEKLFFEAKCCLADNYENGESMFKIAQRIYNLLDELMLDDNINSYLLISHDSVARVIHTYFNNMTNKEFAQFHIQNCQLIEYEFSKEGIYYE